MERPRINAAERLYRDQRDRLLELTDGTGIAPTAPQDGLDFTKKEVEAIYLEGSMGRSKIEWIESPDGRRVGYKFISIDAWCE